MDNNRGLLLFGLGCAAGVVGALLLTSKSGRETVAYLRGKADEGTKSINGSVDNLNHLVTNATERGKKAVRHQAENVSAAVEAGKQAYRAAQETTP
jgi:gas vesicle protein